MDIVQRAELVELAAVADEPCVTVYQPLHPVHPETKGDPILFRNLLDRAEQQLLEREIRAPEVREFLKPARDLQGDDAFWRPSGAAGLAVFVGRGLFRYHRLPYAVPDSADVAAGFRVAPLAHSLVQDVRFLLLAVGPKQIRLFRGDALGMVPVDLPESVPQSEQDLRKQVETEFDAAVQYHTSSGFGAAGSLKGTAHGHGDPREGRKTVYEDFLHYVARGLDPLLKEENLPLFVVAVEETHPVFRKVCRFPLLQPEGVTGSPTELTEAEMFQRALPLAKAWSQRNLDEHRRLYDKQRGTDRAGDDLATLAAAAAQGRVNALFAGMGEHRWGAFDSGSQRAAEHFERQPGDVDLVDLTVKQSLTHGSEVFVVGPRDVPDGKPAVATFRW